MVKRGVDGEEQWRRRRQRTKRIKGEKSPWTSHRVYLSTLYAVYIFLFVFSISRRSAEVFRVFRNSSTSPIPFLIVIFVSIHTLYVYSVRSVYDFTAFRIDFGNPAPVRLLLNASKVFGLGSRPVGPIRTRYNVDNNCTGGSRTSDPGLGRPETRHGRRVAAALATAEFSGLGVRGRRLRVWGWP